MDEKKLTPEQKERKRQSDKAYCAKNSAKRTARTLAWQRANPDRTRANRARYLAANQEKERERNLAWAKAHPECWRARGKRYIQAHPEQRRLNNRRRRARIAGASGTHTIVDIERLFEQQGAKCATCKIAITKSGKKRYNLDHVMPLCRGGSDGPENLQLLCPLCNLRKKNKHPDDWAKENGKLFI